MRSAFLIGVSNLRHGILYNLAFHCYSTYIKQLALNDRKEPQSKTMRYLKMYGSKSTTIAKRSRHLLLSTTFHLEERSA